MKKITFLLIVMFSATFVFAQEEMKPEKFEDVTWQIVEFVKYKSGKVSEAKEIIKKYEAASVDGRMPELYWFVTGSWDLMVVWELDNGPSDLEWKRSADSIKWYKKFMEQQGSMEEVQKVFDAYDAIVDDSEVVMTRKKK